VIENNPTNVFAAFEILLEEIETEIEFLDEVGTEAMGKRDYEIARQAIERASQATDFRKKITSIRKEWETFTAIQSNTVAEEISPDKRRSQVRLQRGVRTPEIAYYLPILKALNELGGSARINVVLEKVEQSMKNELKAVDNELLRSGSDTLRWRNTAQWARNAMVTEGLLKSTSPRGTWEITEIGRIFLKKGTR
jgi:restriction system protein